MASRSSKPTDGRLQLEYDLRADETPTEAVVRALATASDREPEALPPLYDAIDPDSFDAVVRSLDGEFRVEFVHHGFHVSVADGDSVYLHPTGDDE